MAVNRYLLLTLFAFIAYFSTSEAKGKTLVLVENWSIKETHSTLFRTLKGFLINSNIVTN